MKMPVPLDVQVEMLNPYRPSEESDHGYRCVFGRHSVPRHELWYRVDGKDICKDHLLAIVEAFDAYRGAPGISEHELVRAHAKRDKELLERSRIENMQRISSRAPGFVYYIQQGDHIKIGYTIDVKNRMKAYPPSAILLAVHPGTKELEKQMHSQFHAFLDRGREWFTQGPSLMAHIDEVRTKFGDPGMFAYRYAHAKKAS